MNFAEIRFWGLLLIGLGLIALARLVARRVLGDRIGAYDRSSLIILGLFLLACVSLTTVVIFLVVAISSYWGLSILVRHARSRHRWYLMILIPIQLLPLIYYKYADFAVNGVLGLEISTWRDLVIPVGISFYTFQMIGFVIDTLGFRKPLPRFADFMNFAGFFPQIVAGPIERRADLLPQMEKFRFRWSREDLEEGLSWVCLGLFFKLCLADNVALYFHGNSVTNPYLIWLDNLVFGLRIYYDFAGYSLVALGLGRCLGIRLTLNFHSPYAAASIGEFWRRWHITLSQWFRDYVYVPLGGGRTSRWWFNVMIVFVVSGIWHGAGWNFIVWGGLHGLFLIINRMAGPWLKLPRGVGWGLTFSAAMLAWLGFYETRTPELFAKLGALVHLPSYGPDAIREMLTARTSADTFVMACFLLLASGVMILEWLSVTRGKEPYRLLRHPFVLAVLLVLTVWLAPGKNNSFIYFAF